MNFDDLVYLTLQGALIDPLPEVENLFEEGKPCEQWYSDVYDAYIRLCKRLGNDDDTDDDVEIIINSMFSIQSKIAHRMYHYGAIYGYKKERNSNSSFKY